MTEFFDELEHAARTGRAVSDETALAVLDAGWEHVPAIFAATGCLVRRRSGTEVGLCAILNAKSGACGENCAFCAQSVHHDGESAVHALLPEDELLAAHRQATAWGACRFSLVTSGGALPTADLERICATVLEAPGGASWCASLGCLDAASLEKLKQAGVRRYHHNLETARSFFPSICTTHDYDLRVETVRLARETGLEVCCGGIFGLGESNAQRVELAAALAELKVDSIPLNFLIPIPGTPLEDRPVLSPREILLTIAMVRLKNPASEVRIAGGRKHLRSLQSLLVAAGADGMMIGDLLTTKGGAVQEDLQMLADLGLHPAKWDEGLLAKNLL